MKKNLKVILASTIAVVGVAATFGGAFALYTNSANTAEFSIGAYKHSSTGVISYVVGDIHNSLGDNKISPDHPTLELRAPLGGYYSEDIPNQDYVYGNVRVELSIPSPLQAKTRWCVYVDGYNNGTVWDSNFDGLRRLTGPKVDDKNPYVGAEATAQGSIAVNARKTPTVYERDDVLRPTVDNQWVVVYLDFAESLTAESFKNYAEEDFSVDIYFEGLTASCQRPVLVGEHATDSSKSWNKDLPEYTMVPNIGITEGWEWEFKGYTGFSETIVRYLVDATGENDYYIKAPGENYPTDPTDTVNLVIDSTKEYNVYIGGEVTGNRGSLYSSVYEEVYYING